MGRVWGSGEGERKWIQEMGQRRVEEKYVGIRGILGEVKWMEATTASA